MIAVLITVQLAFVGVVVMGMRDTDMTIQRLDASRAFYAAESGANLALRELMTRSDLDSDGTIGTVSNDGNPNNDPVFQGARVYATKTVSAGVTTVTAVARSNAARHTVTVNFVPGAAGFPRRMVYSSWPYPSPQSRTWNGAVWSAPSGTATLSAKQYWAVMKKSPRRREMTACCSVQLGHLEVATLTNTTWGAPVTFTTDVGTLATRTFFTSYEQVTGDALVAYRSGSAVAPKYRTWNGSAWSAEQTGISPLAASPQWIKLVPKPGSDEIMLLIQDTAGGAAAVVWNGTAFGNAIMLESAIPQPLDEAIDAAYEQGTGRCLVAWCQNSNPQPQYRIWDGSSWSVASAAPSIGNVPYWVHLSADSTSSRLMMGCLDSAGHVNVNIWSGAAWGPSIQLETSASTTNTRAFDVAFSGAGNTGAAAWGVSNSNTPRYAIFDGTAWGAPRDASSSLSGRSLIVQLSPDMTTTEIFGLFVTTGGQSTLEFLRFDGANFNSYQFIEGNVSGPTPLEVFMIPDQPPGSPGANGLRAWAEVAPQ
jgi:hypothetical protein